MALEARLTHQMPFVGTADQRAVADTDSKRQRRSIAEIIRNTIDAYYGLEDGMLPEGMTAEEVVERAAARAADQR